MLNKIGKSRILIVIIICTISIPLLFFGFYLNFWHVAVMDWFNTHQIDMESSIIGRMVKSRQDGILSSGGLIGWGSLDSTPVNEDEDQSYINQYLAYMNDLRFGVFTTYDSQIGGQGMLFSILDKSISLPPQEKLAFFHAFTSMLLAIVLTLIILWFYLEFGLTVSIFVLASAFFSHWLVVFGRNLFWSIWAFYLPLVVIMFYLRSNSFQNFKKTFTFGIIIFSAVFIKCLFNGYEYITTTLVMMLVPIIYYSILKRMNFQGLLNGLFTAVFSSCLAILLSFVILCFQIASVTGNFQAGVNHIIYSFEKRTYANPQDFPPDLTPSLEASPSIILNTYIWGNTFSDVNNFIYTSNEFISSNLFKIRYGYLIIGFWIMSGMLNILGKRFYRDEERKLSALVLTTWFSILAPLSWFIIFKAHSYRHIHMNYIVWQMPFVFFGFAVCGLVVKKLWSILFRNTLKSFRIP